MFCFAIETGQDQDWARRIVELVLNRNIHDLDSDSDKSIKNGTKTVQDFLIKLWAYNGLFWIVLVDITCIWISRDFWFWCDKGTWIVFYWTNYAIGECHHCLYTIDIDGILINKRWALFIWLDLNQIKLISNCIHLYDGNTIFIRSCVP